MLSCSCIIVYFHKPWTHEEVEEQKKILLQLNMRNLKPAELNISHRALSHLREFFGMQQTVNVNTSFSLLAISTQHALGNKWTWCLWRRARKTLLLSSSSQQRHQVPQECHVNKKETGGEAAHKKSIWKQRSCSTRPTSSLQCRPDMLICSSKTWRTRVMCSLLTPVLK